MAFIKTRDGTHLYYKDWGKGAPVVLLHGWPATADMWESQALALAEAGYRVIAYDRRGFGRSEQPFTGYDYDTLADDLAGVLEALDLNDATLVGFSMGGGEVARYASRHGGKRVKQNVLVSSVVPFLLKTSDNPDGVPGEMFDDMKNQSRQDRPKFLRSFVKTFYGNGMMNIGGVSEEMLEHTQTICLMASPKAHLDCIDAFGRTDFRGDLTALAQKPLLAIHGTSDKTVPIDVTLRQTQKAIPQGTYIEYDGEPHGLFATAADRLTKDLLDFLGGGVGVGTPTYAGTADDSFLGADPALTGIDPIGGGVPTFR